MTTPRPPFPSFTPETAVAKVRAAGDGGNSRDPQRVSLAYTVDSGGDAAGLMKTRHASINDVAIAPGKRLFHWPLGEALPADHARLSALGL